MRCFTICTRNSKTTEHFFDAFCLQETWLKKDADLALFQIPGYQYISKGKTCSQHGGLVTYLHENFVSTEINKNSDSLIWEGQFILVKDIESNEEIILGNIYRPPFDNNGRENVRIFIEELNPIISHFNKSCRDIVITGDFNINLLHVNNANKGPWGSLDLMLGYILTAFSPKSHFQHALVIMGAALSLMIYSVKWRIMHVFASWHTAHQTLRSLPVLHELVFRQPLRKPFKFRENSENKGKQHRRLSRTTLWFTKLEYHV